MIDIVVNTPELARSAYFIVNSLHSFGILFSAGLEHNFL